MGGVACVSAGVHGRWLGWGGAVSLVVSSVEGGYVAIENGRREEVVDDTTVINDTTATLLPAR